MCRCEKLFREVDINLCRREELLRSEHDLCRREEFVESEYDLCRRGKLADN